VKIFLTFAVHALLFYDGTCADPALTLADINITNPRLNKLQPPVLGDLNPG
jgi:hypothetical protein